MTESLPFSTRLWFAFACFFRVLFDGAFAGRAWDAREDLQKALPEPKPAPAPQRAETTTALQLLGLLQRDGRLVDFLKQDVAGFGDAEIGAAARVVHEGCKKALFRHADIEPVRDEEEGSSLTLEAGFDAARVKLTGNVAGSAPYRGTLRHRGWHVTRLDLPEHVKGHDLFVLAPAEVEL